jgi:hypothetical protein
VLTHLNVAQDGVEALSSLRQEGQYASIARPDLIMLDLNLPKKDGREVRVGFTLTHVERLSTGLEQRVAGFNLVLLDLSLP